MTRGPYRARPEPGSIADLVLRFRQSPRFLAWAPSTRAKNDKILGDFLAANGRHMVADLTRGAVLGMRDSLAATPGAANNWHKVIRALLAYAVDLEMIPHNPAAGVRRLKPRHAGGFRVWREDEIAAYLAHWPVASVQHRALATILCTGASAADAVKLGPGSLRGDRVVYGRAKTGVVVDLPLMPELRAAAAHAPHLTWLARGDGLPRTAKGLTVAMPLWAQEAGLGGKDEAGRRLCCHGLRKAFGRRLADAGCSVHEIAAILGHLDLAQVRTYTQGYDRARAADSGMARLGTVEAGNVVRLRRGE
jgi:integrase